MEFFQAVGRRYSQKKAFDPGRKVPAEDLQSIVQAGMAAPSAGNGQSPEFVIVNDEATVRRIGDISQWLPLQTAPAIILVLSQPAMRQELGPHTECLIGDAMVATENMLLACTALGYCCGLVDGPFLKLEIQRGACALLGIPDDRIILVAIPVGHPGEPEPHRPKKPFGQRASWNRYAIDRS
jgi:nitroreductase